MAYPFITSFKYRALPTATSSSTASTVTAVTIPFRSKYLFSIANYQGLVSQTAPGVINLLVNGSTATADSFVSNPFISASTTSTAAVSGGFSSLPNNTAVLFLNSGDVLATSGTSMVPYSVTHIVQEF